MCEVELLCDRVIAAICAGGPIHKIGPAYQISAAYNMAGEPPGSNDSSEGIFADIKPLRLGLGNCFLDVQNVTMLNISHSLLSSFKGAQTLALVVTQEL